MDFIISCTPHICDLWRRGSIQSVDDSRNVAQYRQQDVDEKIGVAAALEEDTDRWEEDGKNDLADVARIMTYVSKAFKMQCDCTPTVPRALQVGGCTWDASNMDVSREEHTLR